MAELIDADDRGQMILIGAVAIAFAMIVLIVVLNTVLFVDQVSTRETAPRADVASGYVGFAQESIAATMAQVNANDSTVSRAAATNRSLNRIDDIARDQYVNRYGMYTSLGVTEDKVHNGTQIKQTSQREFTSSTGDANWFVVNNGTDNVRDFNMTVDNTQLDDTVTATAFRIQVTGAGGNIQEFRLVDPGTDDIRVEEGPPASLSTACTDTGTDTTVEFDLSNAELNGTDCSFVLGEGLSPPYDIQFLNGDNGEGTYTMVVNGTPQSTVESPADPDSTIDNLNSPPGSPYFAWGIYSVSSTVEVRSDGLNFTTELRVATNESEGMSP